MKGPRGRLGSVAVAVLGLLAGACGGEAETDRAPDEAPAATAAPQPAVEGAGDQQFLREMTDHHHGMITMAHEAMEKTGAAVREEARAIDEKQDAEIEEMLGILLRDHNDPHTPTLTPDAQAMADALSQKSGTDYDMTFRMNAIQHHEQGIAMIDRALPSLSPEIRTMAERMKADQQREIQELQARMQH